MPMNRPRNVPMALPADQATRAAIRHAAYYTKWQKKMGWIALYNSDGHSEKMVGTFYNLIETPNGVPPGEEALVQLLRQGEVRGFQDDELIRRSINGGW